MFWRYKIHVVTLISTDIHNKPAEIGVEKKSNLFIALKRAKDRCFVGSMNRTVSKNKITTFSPFKELICIISGTKSIISLSRAY